MQLRTNELRSMIERLGTRASAGTPQDAATFGDVVMLTVPLKAVLDAAVVLVRDAGFEPVVVGPLARGRSPSLTRSLYNTGMSGQALHLAAAAFVKRNELTVR